LEGGVKKPLSKMERGWGEVKKAKAKVLNKKRLPFSDSLFTLKISKLRLRH
jgi:hypothetical protein